MAYGIGPVSGCHINPAVTIGLWAIKKTETKDVPFYLGGQIVGGLVGALVIFVVADSISGFSAKATGFASNGYGKHSPGGFGMGAADRKSTRLNSSHLRLSRMPSSA